jgi:hypothetical protein
MANIHKEDEFKSQVKSTLEKQVGYVDAIEKRLALTEEGGVAAGLDQEKGQTLDKLSAVELESIRKELTRQRDTMSKKLIRNTEINVRLEKERENVFKSIQEEGKMLIKKCNILRRAGLILKYKIGVSEKRAKDLTDELGSHQQKEEEFQKRMINESKPQKKTLELPYIEYKSKQVIRKPAGPPTEVDDFESIPPGEIVNRLLQRQERMKDIDKLYEEARLNNLAVDQYQDRLNNFVNG